MKKIIAILLSVLTLCSLAACAKKQQTGSGEQIANPFVTCQTMADAEKLAGFSFTVPDTVEGYTGRELQAIENQMIQAIYTNGDKSLMLRKGTGSDDISGDYNEYSEKNTVQVGELSVTMKGDNGTVSVAVWTNGGCAYAVETQDVPMSADAVSQLIAQLG